MNIQDLHIEKGNMHKLLAAASGDVALLYLYLKSGNPLSDAGEALRMPESRVNCAVATLGQLGLWSQEREVSFIPGERPAYSEKDVLQAMDSDGEFKLLYSEVQRLLGRNLNTEELKILLSFLHYLGLSPEVVSVLVSYCKTRARSRGSLRNPSLRTIEKEAYSWAERGIDTLEQAAAYIHTQNTRYSQLGQLMNLLQIRGRTLTQGEEKYALGWLEMGFPMEVIAQAYERTCLNTGGLNWYYMNKILNRWNEAGLKTLEQIKNNDRKPGASGGKRQLDAEEQAAIAKLLQEV